MPETTEKRQFFDRPEFPILSVPDRVAFVDEVDDLSKLFHEEIEIKLFLEGSATLLIGKETVITQPGDVVVINPYEIHSTVDDGQQKGTYHLLMIGLDFFAQSRLEMDLRRQLLGRRIRFNTLIRNHPRLQQILLSLTKELQEREEYYQQAVRGLVLELFSLLLRDQVNPEALSCPLDETLRYYSVVYPAIRKIRLDYQEKLSVDQLAAMCRVSKYHFCRIFKAVTTMTAVQYQTEYRLQIADLLLARSDQNLTEIAARCGFEDESYFSRCYKKRYGLAPQRRRAILSKE